MPTKFTEIVSDSLTLTNSDNKTLTTEVVDAPAVLGSVVTAGGSVFNRSLSDSLIYTDANQTVLGLDQEVSYTNGLSNISLTDVIQLTQSGQKVIPLSVSDSITLINAGNTTEFERLVDYIYPAYSVSYNKSYGIADIISVTQTVVTNVILNLSITDSLTLIQSVFNWPDTCDNPATRTTIVFTYGSSTLEVASPNMGDAESLSFNRVKRQTRGGDLKIYRDPTWGKNKRINYTLSNLKETQRNEFFEFLNNSLGQEIGILDFNSNQWLGVVLNPQTLMTEDATDSDISFQFEGVIQ